MCCTRVVLQNALIAKAELGLMTRVRPLGCGRIRVAWPHVLSCCRMGMVIIFAICGWVRFGYNESTLYAAELKTPERPDAAEEQPNTDAEIVSYDHSPFQLKMLTDSNAGEKTPRSFENNEVLDSDHQKSMTCTEGPTAAGRLEICERGKPVLVYNASEQIRDEITDSRNRRACYVHPLYGLQGEVLTDDFPKDHYHHHGLFWGWMHVAFEGIDGEFDNWTHPETLRFVHHRWLRREAAADQAILAVENGWYLTDSKGQRTSDSLMRERITLTVHPEQDNLRLIDFSGEWTPTTRAVTLRGAEGKSYGGVNIRFAPHQDSVITVADGVTSEDLPIARLTWADFTAKFVMPSQTKAESTESMLESGIVLMISPNHPDYPPTWLTRHYGVLCIGWPGVDGQTFKPGETFKLDYRILTHKKPLSVEALREIYANYVSEIKSKTKVVDSNDNNDHGGNGDKSKAEQKTISMVYHAQRDG